MDSAENFNGSSNKPSKWKRQKVVVACDHCRSRKVKCDGSRPVCTPCQKRYGTSAICSWNTGSARVDTHPPWQYVHRLEARIRELEHQPQQQNISRQMDPYIGDLGQGEWTNTTFCEKQTASSDVDQWTGNLESPPTGTHLHSAQAPLHVSSADTGVMPVMIGASPDELRSREIQASSSAGSFIQQIRKVVEQKTHTRSSATTRDQDNLPLIVPNEDVGQKQTDYVLPTRKQADSLIEIYWQNVHPLYPFIGKRMTTADYKTLWSGDGTVPHERSFLCLLNLMFALASQLIAPQERSTMPSVFYARAKDLLDLENTASVRYVQIYLHFGLYLQSTNESHQCWVFIGLAIRTAQSLELHVPETSERLTSNTRFRELIRRVWHGCVLLDRVLAMTYGRPCMIGRRLSHSVPHPTAVDGEQLSLDPSMSGSLLPTEKPSLNDFFVYSLTLYDILHDILVNFYPPEAQRAQSLDDVYEHYFEASARPRGEFTVLEIDRRLSKWEKGVPSFLKMSRYPVHSEGPVTVLSRQAVILRQRYLHVRLLSLRPVLSAFIALDCYERDGHPSLENFLSRQVIFQCAVNCVKVAQEAIGIIDKRRTNNPGHLAAWWYNVLFLYISATVLIAARLSPLVLAEMTEVAIFDSWRQVMEAFQQYSIHGTSTKKLSTTLAVLFNTVPQQFSRLRQVPAEKVDSLQTGGSANAATRPAQQGFNGCSIAESQSLHASFVDRNFAEMNWVDFDSDDILGLNSLCDPNDMSWLTTAPFEM